MASRRAKQQQQIFSDATIHSHEQQHVHDRAEELRELLEVFGRVEALEPSLERAQVLAVVVGF